MSQGALSVTLSFAKNKGTICPKISPNCRVPKKTRITVFVARTDFSGGKTAIVIRMAELFQQAGFDVTLCAFWRVKPNWLRRHPVISSVPSGLKVKHILSYGWDGFRPFAAYKTEERTTRRQRAKFERFLASLDTDIIYVPNSGHYVHAANLKHVPKGVFKILGDHSAGRYHFADNHENPQALVKKQKRFFRDAGRFDALHLVNPLMTSFLDGAVDNVIDIPNFVEQQPEPAHVFLKSRTIAAAGRLTEIKNFGDMIKAFGICHARFPDWRLEIYGKGPMRAELETLIASLRLENAVAIHEPGPQFKTALSKAACHVSSSQFESFGLTLAEAMSFGVPVVTQHNHIGAKYLLADGRGLIAQNPTVDGLAQVMAETMRCIETGDIEGHLRNQVRLAYDFSLAISPQVTMQAWKNALKECIPVGVGE